MRRKPVTPEVTGIKTAAPTHGAGRRSGATTHAESDTKSANATREEVRGEDALRRLEKVKSALMTLLPVNVLFFLSGLFVWGMVLWPVLVQGPKGPIGPQRPGIDPAKPAGAQKPGFDRDNFEPITVLPKPIRPINPFDFTIKSVHEANAVVAPENLVLGVKVGTEARAYPLNMLAGPDREIFNDELGGRAIAATWCHLSHNAVVYCRKVNGQTLTFQASGKLWGESLVMRDQQTKSEWSHILGQGMTGPLKGTRLERIPSVVTDWETWSQLHPHGTVATVPPRLKGLDFSREMIQMPEQFVLGIVWKGRPYAWGFWELFHMPLWNTQLEETQVVVFFDRQSGTARLFERRTIQDKMEVLEFSRDGKKIIDIATKSEWEFPTGKAVRGPLSGETLIPLPATVSFRHTWERFYPDSKWEPR